MTKLLTRMAVVGVVAVAAVALGPGRAEAQPPPPAGRFGPAVSPPISPYLNLLRRGGGTASNYYNIVRPQQDLYRNTQLLQQQITANRQAIQTAYTAIDAGLPETGKSTAFLNTGGYFMNMAPAARGVATTGGVGGGGRVGTGPQPAGRGAVNPPGRIAPRR